MVEPPLRPHVTLPYPVQVDSISTCLWLYSSAGNTSFTVLSTKTPPTIRKHFLSGAVLFSVSITKLKREGQGKRGEKAVMEGTRLFYISTLSNTSE